jgi:hypothetical protein
MGMGVGVDVDEARERVIVLVSGDILCGNPARPTHGPVVRYVFHSGMWTIPGHCSAKRGIFSAPKTLCRNPSPKPYSNRPAARSRLTGPSTSQILPIWSR